MVLRAHIWIFLFTSTIFIVGRELISDSEAVYDFSDSPGYFAQDTIPAENCLECHGDLMADEEKHNPATKECSRCHISNGQEHPLENASTFNLGNQVPDLCYECHLPKNEDDFVHQPAQEGKCTLCHSVHSSPNLYLVKANPVSGVCIECHELETPVGSNSTHQAIADGSCTSCHNPHQSSREHLFTSSQSRVCRSCHNEIRSDQRKDHVHEPFKADCLSCHKGHNSVESHLLVQKPKDLCLSCHEEVHNTIQTASLVHGALEQEKTCLNCHSPHSSDEEKILWKNDVELCLDCHSEAITTPAGVVDNIGEMLQEGNLMHGAIEAKGCTFCHKSHTSERSKLLAFEFPMTNYAKAETENFDLCFQCHKEELFKDEITTTATNFRNGDKNLHSVHVNGEKGRNCNLCHNVHGTTSEHLIDEKVTFGNWEMPLNYEKLPEKIQNLFHQDINGGSCLPGCHSKKAYVREAHLDSVKILKPLIDSLLQIKRGGN